MTCHPYASLDIVKNVRQTDGTYKEERLSLLDGKDGIWLMDWQPGVLNYKNGGTIVDSPLSEGRIPVHTVWDDISETFTLGISGEIQDSTIRSFRELGEDLVDAVLYWTSWSEQMVWLEAKTAYETNTRYALLKMWSLPGHNNPFQNPFTYLSHRDAALSNVPLTIVHLPWQDTVPGTGECVETSGTGTKNSIWYLSFEAGNDNVNCGSAASVDDLPLTQMTVECWVRFTNSPGVIASKGTFGPPDVGWFFLTSGSGELSAQVSVFPQSAVSVGNTVIADGNWHHVLMTFDFGALILPNTAIYLAIDGVWETYKQQIVAGGAYSTDTAINLILGNLAALNFGFDGDIAWVRINSSIVYNPSSGNFTPESRCAIPTVLANTELLVIYEGTGATTSDLSGNGNNGTITGADWESDCVGALVGRIATCLDEVYTANKTNLAQLTHVFVYDAGTATYSANLLGSAFPQTLYPAVPAVGDILYIGIETALANTGPFNNIVFDIGAAQVNLTMANGWQYWNGAAWAALSEYDGTEQRSGIAVAEPFTNTGVRSVHFPQPTTWATNAVNGVTGYWVKLEITAIGAAPAPPTQQNRDIYTTTWNGITVDDGQIAGDISPLFRLKVRARSAGPADFVAPIVRTRIGIRSTYRGDNFAAWLNAADEQNPPGVTFSTTDASTAIANRIEAPSGRATDYTPAGASAITTRMRWVFDRSIARDFYGRFSVFARCVQISGNADDFAIRLRCGQSSTASPWDNITKKEYVNSTGTTFLLVQLGLLTIPSGSYLQTDNPAASLQLNLEIESNNAGGGQIRIYDIALLPVDEWAGTFYEVINTAGGGSYLAPLVETRYLDIDDVTSPKDFLRSIVRLNLYGEEVDFGSTGFLEDDILANFAHIGIDRAPLSMNEQKVFFISEEWFVNAWYAHPDICASVSMESINRYLSMRGDS